MKNRLSLLATMAFVVLSGCAARHMSVNADIIKGEPVKLFGQVQQLQEGLPMSKVFEDLGIPRDRFTPMRAKEIMAVVFGTENPNVSNLAAAEDYIKTHPGFMLQLQDVDVRRRPDFSWSGLVGIREIQKGPDQWLYLVSKGCTQLTLDRCTLGDAKIGGPFDVNINGVQWIWSLLPTVIESTISTGAQQGIKAAF